MAEEIEYKFLVLSGAFKTAAVRSARLKQGYFDTPAGLTVRIRIADSCAQLTVKGKTQDGVRRSEYEYDIPVADAEAMLAEFCAGRLVEKIRYFVPYRGHTWEVDEYLGDNSGLLTAEIELAEPDEPFEKPEWVGLDISRDRRYTNAMLARHPFAEFRS